MKTFALILFSIFLVSSYSGIAQNNDNGEVSREARREKRQADRANRKRERQNRKLFKDPKTVKTDCNANTLRYMTLEECKLQQERESLISESDAKKECGAACKLYTPIGRLVAASIMSGLSWTVYGVAANEVEDIEENIANLKNAREKILASKGPGLDSCSENDFENSEKPNCYCFTRDNSINRDRDPVGVCASLFANYQRRELNTAKNEIRGCVTQGGRFDLKCQCKTKKTGPNSCHKTTSLSFPGFGKGAKSLLASPFLAGNDLNGGGIRRAGAYAEGDGRSIAKLAKKVIEKKLGKKKANQINRLTGLEIGRIAKSPYFNKAGATLASRNSGANLLSSLPNKVKNNLKKAVPSSIALADKAYSRSRGSNKNRSRRNKDEFKIGNSEEFAIDGLEQEVASNKNYNYKDSDISNISGASIFKVISSRYHRSAFRRLFEETK